MLPAPRRHRVGRHREPERVAGLGVGDLRKRQPRHALVEFASRASLLTPARLEELAQIAAPLTADASDDADGVRRLLAQARWLSGDQ